jgi:hypothetical protein
MEVKAGRRLIPRPVAQDIAEYTLEKWSVELYFIRTCKFTATQTNDPRCEPGSARIEVGRKGKLREARTKDAGMEKVRHWSPSPDANAGR